MFFFYGLPLDSEQSALKKKRVKPSFLAGKVKKTCFTRPIYTTWPMPCWFNQTELLWFDWAAAQAQSTSTSTASRISCAAVVRYHGSQDPLHFLPSSVEAQEIVEPILFPISTTEETHETQDIGLGLWSLSDLCHMKGCTGSLYRDVRPLRGKVGICPHNPN
jgi:hypothetical protein